MPGMRIGVDGRALRAGGARRGTAVYLEQLLAALVREFPDDHWDVLVPGAVRAGTLPEAASVRVVHTARAAHAAGAMVGRPRLDELLEGADLVWVPAVLPVGLSPGARAVLTVHDLSFVHRPRDYGAYERVWHRLARPRRLARRAQRVIAVSEGVREELIGEWGLEPDRVVTVPSGPGRPRASADEPAAGGSGSGEAAAGGAGAREAAVGAREAAAGAPRAPYVLAVGGIEPRKLPLVLVEAHRLARERGLRAALVFAGDGRLAARVREAGATVLAPLPDRELDALIEGALCVVTASREEGFGFAPHEALARGVPPVVSDLPVFRDLLGDAAIYVRPGDPDALAAALLELERDAGRRTRLVTAGAAGVTELSWERAARATRAVLEEAVR